MRSALPEPGNAWIGHHWASVPWPTPMSLDLVRGTLDWGADRGSVEGRMPSVEWLWRSLEPRSLSDTVWLPPGQDGAEVQAVRIALLERLVAAGVPVAVQERLVDVVERKDEVDGAVALAGLSDLPGSPDGERLVLRLVDCTSALVHGSCERTFEALDESRVGVSLTMLWLLVPLIRGLSEPIAPRIHTIARRLGVAGVLWVAPRLEAADRRRLFERAQRSPASGVSRDERLYDELFHADGPDLDDVLESGRGQGVETLVPRPLPSHPVRLRCRRDAAGLLLSVAEIRRRCGASEVSTQELSRAALWLDRNDVDIRSLVREGHQRLIPELRGVEDLLESWRRSGTEDVLRFEWKATQSTTPM